MIASVLPLQRLPRRLGIFDYHIPEALAGILRPGHMVRIPFRASEQLGLVVRIAEKQKTAELKELQGLLNAEPFATPSQLALLPAIAAWYGVSVATVAKLLLPPLKKTKLAAAAFSPLSEIKRAGERMPPAYHWYRSPAEHAHCLSHAISSQTLLLVATVAQLRDIQALLPGHVQNNAVFWHSGMTEKERFDAWVRVRNGEGSVVVGTRSAVFLPFSSLHAVIIDYEHDENHKQWEGAPLYHAKDVAGLLAEIFGAHMHAASFSPSFESYRGVFDGSMLRCGEGAPPKKSERWLAPIQTLPTVISMREERKKKNFSLFAEAVEGALRHARGDIFLFLNRTGFATSVGCNDCGYGALCSSCALPLVFHESDATLRCHYCARTEPMPLTCPSCGAPVVALRGAGTELAEKELRRLVGAPKDADILRVDSTTAPPPDSGKRRFVIGTEMAFPWIRWGHTDCIVFLDIDKQMNIPEFNAIERVWHLIETVQYHRQKESVFLIQTVHPEHLLFRSLREPDRLYRTDLASRKSLGYPPYAYLVRYIIENRDADDVKKTSASAHIALQRRLTEEKKRIILHPPIETHPAWYRGAHRRVMIARLLPDRFHKDLPWLNSQFSDEWGIDPNPVSLLSL